MLSDRRTWCYLTRIVVWQIISGGLVVIWQELLSDKLYQEDLLFFNKNCCLTCYLTGGRGLPGRRGCGHSGSAKQDWSSSSQEERVVYLKKNNKTNNTWSKMNLLCLPFSINCLATEILGAALFPGVLCLFLNMFLLKTKDRAVIEQYKMRQKHDGATPCSLV